MKRLPPTDVPTVPEVDLDRIRATYAELKRMEVKLDPNPIEYGPKRFNNRIARVRSMLNRVEQIFLQTSEDLHYFQRIINSRRTYYELEKRELMAKNTAVRVGRSQQEREALADVILREQIEQVIVLEQSARDLETLMISIKSKRTDLKDVQGRMRDQMKLIEHDIGMGARWGHNSGPSEFTESVNEIDSMLQEVDKDLGVIEEDEEDEEVLGDGSEEEESSEEDSEGDEEEEPSEEEAEPEPAAPPEPPAPKKARGKKRKEPEAEAPGEDGVLNFLGVPSEEAPPNDEGDPAPRIEEPVLTFGAEEEPPAASPAASEADLDTLLGEGPAEDLPPDENSPETADAFLAGLDPDAVAEPPDNEPLGEEVGIDDLIASFADD